jgi:hypothetical protein
LTGIVNGTPVKVRGFPQPFGQATAVDDFNAVTLIDVTNAPPRCWSAGPRFEATPFGAIAPNSLRLNPTNAGVARRVPRWRRYSPSDARRHSCGRRISASGCS